jgi:serine protease Do
VGELGETVRRLLGLDGGIVVRRVYSECFRSAPSLRAGDVLLEWGGRKLASAEEFGRLYDDERPGEGVPYLVRRGPRSVRGAIVIPGPDCRPPDDPPAELPKAGLTLAWDSSKGVDSPGPAWTVRAVRPKSPAEETGIRPSDRILGANGSRPDRDDVLRALDAFEKRGRATVLTLLRADRVELVALSSRDGR